MLKSDGLMQVEVARWMKQFNYLARVDSGHKGKSDLKLGRYREGINKNRKCISWLQDYCAVLNGNQPAYDELSALQWAQGPACCALEEHDNKIRRNMFSYSKSNLQNAIELSFVTAIRAHWVILQETEKGIVNYSNPDAIVIKSDDVIRKPASLLLWIIQFSCCTFKP